MRRNSVKTTAFCGQPQARATVNVRSSPRTSASPLAFTWMDAASLAQARSSESSSRMRFTAAAPRGLPSSFPGPLHSSASSSKPERSRKASAAAAHSAPASFPSSESASLVSVCERAKVEEARILR